MFASLIKDGTTRKILYTERFEFIAPEFIKEEMLKYEKELISKIKIPPQDFRILLSLLFEKITLISKKDMKSILRSSKAKFLIQRTFLI